MAARKKRRSRGSKTPSSRLPLIILLLIVIAAGVGFVLSRYPHPFSKEPGGIREEVLSEREGRSAEGPPQARREAETKDTGMPAPPASHGGSELASGVPVSSIPLPPRSPINEADRAPQGVTGKIALTFDAGAAEGGTESVLQTLKAEGLHCTFFLTGKWVDRNRALARTIARNGHEIANHTYSHKDLTTLSDEEITEELAKAESIILEVAGVSSKPYFRPPFGARNAHVIEVATKAGYLCVYWTVDSWDAYKVDITADEIARRVLSRAQDGCIVLMHCGSTETAKALPRIINELSRRYELVTVSELLGRG